MHAQAGKVTRVFLDGNQQSWEGKAQHPGRAKPFAYFGLKQRGNALIAFIRTGSSLVMTWRGAGEVSLLASWLMVTVRLSPALPLQFLLSVSDSGLRVPG